MNNAKIPKSGFAGFIRVFARPLFNFRGARDCVSGFCREVASENHF